MNYLKFHSHAIQKWASLFQRHPAEYISKIRHFPHRIFEIKRIYCALEGATAPFLNRFFHLSCLIAGKNQVNEGSAAFTWAAEPLNTSSCSSVVLLLPRSFICPQPSPPKQLPDVSLLSSARRHSPSPSGERREGAWWFRLPRSLRSGITRGPSRQSQILGDTVGGNLIRREKTLPFKVTPHALQGGVIPSQQENMLSLLKLRCREFSFRIGKRLLKCQRQLHL